MLAFWRGPQPTRYGCGPAAWSSTLAPAVISIHRLMRRDSRGASMRRAVLAAMAALSLTASARADLQFCNKTSYVLDLALSLEEKDAAATRGWLRVDPGACRTVLQGAVTAEKIYVHG